ncbi:MAG TPA: glycosyltransferase family 2 protein [Bryobacteraceae bacterium]|nr:glycosyltransferase family 2 protein [Bryobacteraceae bacterium]
MQISVIIPVFNGGDTLPFCLQALHDSLHPAAECIVIDDGSTDDSAALAARFGATVLSTEGCCGPAKSRNLGSGRASGDLLLFIDADVAIHSDALGRIAQRFENEADLDALIGAYDKSPGDPGFISQFKNLMHAFVHRQGNRQASTFWCGCGAVKRSVYLELGGLDESYRRPSVEDIEFGFRMMDAGRKLALDAAVQCKHLKVWTLWSLVRTDVLQRGIPWTELILRTRFLPNDLNLSWSQRVSAALSFLLITLGGLEIWQFVTGHVRVPASLVAAGMLACLASIGFLNRGFYQFLASAKSWPFSLAAVLLHILYYIYSGISLVLGAGLYALRAALPGTSVQAAGEDLQP